jgi:hypothetical protein
MMRFADALTQKHDHYANCWSLKPMILMHLPQESQRDNPAELLSDYCPETAI